MYLHIGNKINKATPRGDTISVRRNSPIAPKRRQSQRSALGRCMVRGGGMPYRVFELGMRKLLSLTLYTRVVYECFTGLGITL